MRETMNTYLGIDYGGTKLLIGEVEEGGRLLKHRRYETGLMGQERIKEYILACLEDYLLHEKAGNSLLSAGIGIVGTSDWENGLWLSANHEAGIPVPLALLVENRLGVPAFVDNDVRSAASAELLWGYGRRCRNFIYINAGTGLAAGIVADGILLRGGHHEAGEVGHQVVDRESSVSCVCGRKGCAELFASGLGLHNRAQTLRACIPTGLPLPLEGKRTPASQIFDFAKKGDRLCVELTDTAADTLACLIMNLVRTTDPDRVIVGGGLTSDSWFLEKVAARLDAVTMRFVEGGLTVSGFDRNFAGLIGAAARGAMGSGKIKNKKES